MHFSCDITLNRTDSIAIEWIVFVRAKNFAEAVAFAEAAVAERWQGAARISELFVSPDENSREKQAAGADQSMGLYASRGPREIVRVRK